MKTHPATTPRQPAKRAKGRAEYWSIPYTVDEPGSAGWTLYEKDYEAAVERMARAISRDAGGDPLPFTRIDARLALRAIGIAAPRKERGSR